MKLSEAWLREWVNPELSTADLVEQITMAGLEVDGVEAVAGEFSGVVVGEILTREQHPDADKLSVCMVKGDGAEPVQVICGAPNARAGIKIPYATIGAVLPPGADGKPFKIKKAKLRGIESFGMLCAQAELKLGDGNDGIWELPEDAPVGTCVREYLQLNDSSIEIDLTPNRSDCLSIKGVARDVGVLNRLAVNEPEIAAVAPSIDDTFPVALNAGEACSRYAGRVIRNVDVAKPTPLWMQERLRRADIRSIDAVVDITNYVLLELGQPMHAFDLSTLNGSVQARMAEQGEKLTLLDGQDIELNADTMVIADDSRAVAMAGIMGGEATAVTAETKDIFLESAFFDPIAIAGRARSYGLHTDSSHRFERGVDYQLQETAIERATQLLLDIVGGEAGPIGVVENEYKPVDREVSLRRARINSGLGFDMDDDTVIDILIRLGLSLQRSDDEGWTFAVPSYRFDISIEADLLEELARVYGYNNLPVTSMSVPMLIESDDEAAIGLSSLHQVLVNRGYQEAITYSFVEPKLQEMFDKQHQAVALSNPISADMAVMRTTLWPGLVKALQYNQNRQQSRVRLFETGQRFLPEAGGLIQDQVIAGAVYGSRQPEGWAEKQQPIDFFDVKADIEALLAVGGSAAEYRFEPAKHDVLHPGQCARIERNGSVIGFMGALHPSLLAQLGVSGPVFLFELKLADIETGVLPNFEELSKFPETRRDLALIVDESVPVATLLDIVKQQGGEWLKNTTLFDVYQGEGIDNGKKSLALGLTWQHPSRTLTDEEVNDVVESIVSNMQSSCGAMLRG
ncbi:MAG: phenylalanine--tRNA ligase subunit beta [Motiliproteus sp.]|nr:phenylalanine--tRNA ligase subunit beta [Motiliproteus sp.]MCW9052269.1 phenylalanine--tRNA ligase subunit beta [Motiliproteus sp.]